MPTPTCQELVEHALAVTTADDCVVLVTSRTGANLRWANNTLTTNGVMTGVDVTVIAFANSGQGTAAASVSGSASTTSEVEELVRAADTAAREAPPAPDAAALEPGRVDADWEAAPGGTDIGVFSEVAPGLGEAFGIATGAGRVLYGFVEHRVATTYVGSSTGLRLRHEQPTGHVACTGKTADLSRSAWVGLATDDFAGVDPIALEATLAQRLAWGERQLDLPAGRYDTVLPPTSVADLMIDAYWYAGARDAQDGQSFYSQPGGGTKIGQRIARPGVRLHSDPTAPGIACAPFVTAASSSSEQSVFDNGLPLTATDWIADGTLTSLIQTRHSAGLTAQPVTPYVDNLVLDVGGSGATEDLVAGVEDGLLLTCMWYIREVDPQSLLLTGLTRDGVYRIRGGEIVGEVNNFRWNESPIDLLNRFTHAGAPERSFSREWGDDYFNRTITPARRIPDFNMSSVSQAR